jgi:Fe-S-cluster containining protein
MQSDLVQIVDAAFADAATRSGVHLVCRAGCTQCCIGVFPISQQDATRLREGLECLSTDEPARADRVRARVVASLQRLNPHFPGDITTGILSDDDAAHEAFDDFANDEPCPVLDPATGTCDLYSSRPILCRTFGPPARTEDGNLAHCELCYTQAEPYEIATCEIDPAIPGLEASSNEAFNHEHHLQGETLIAYALRSA